MLLHFNTFAYYNFNKIKISKGILILEHGRVSGMSYIEKKIYIGKIATIH